jgi:hypothetical protein
MDHVVSEACQGRTCEYYGCGLHATHQVGEIVAGDAATRPSTAAFVCCVHFRRIFGEAAMCPPPQRPMSAPPPSTTRVQRRLNFAARVCEEKGWNLGALTPLQLKELRRLQDEQPPSDAIAIHQPEPHRGR